MRCYFFILCFSPFLHFIDGANILGMFPLPGKSHFIMFEGLMKALAKRGHQVDVVSHFPQKEPIEGYNDIQLIGSEHQFVNNLTMEFLKIVTGNHILSLYGMMKMAGLTTCEETFNSDVAKDLLQSTRKYDLVITETFVTDCMLGWGHHFGVPTIAMSSCEAFSWINDRYGNPDNPSYIPNFLAQGLTRMTLYERVANTYYSLISRFVHKIVSERQSETLAKQFFGQDMPSLRDLAYNTSLIFVNSHFSIHQARPTVPNFVEVGGLHIGDPQPLNKHFQELLTTDSKGIIYLTMGSMVKTETFDVEKIQGLFDAFAELPYKVLWKAVKEDFPKEVKFPKNIHFEKWMPQFDILCHPNVKLFVSHGGLMGGQEATYCGVPRLGIPLFGDQETNIKQAEVLGIAKRIAYDDITKESVLSAATEMLNNPKYQENAKLVSEQFKDRPSTPLDTAVYWTEYVIRHKGAPQLRSVGAELPWYQYLLLDVAAILILVPVILSYLLLHIIKLIFKIRKQKSKKD